jgi:hypothetical protein
MNESGDYCQMATDAARKKRWQRTILMPLPRRHHWVPQFYLKNFAIPETAGSKCPKVWVFHRERGDELTAAVGNIAVQKDLYAVATPDGGRDYQMEHELGKLESMISDSRLWEPLSHDFIDLGHLPYRKAIALFLATLFARNPSRRQEQGRFHSRLVRSVEAVPKDSRGNPTVRAVVIGKQEIPFDPVEWGEYKNQTDADLDRAFVEGIRPNAGFIARELIKKRWSIDFADEPLFVTSTNPLVVLSPELKPFQILGPGSTLMFPISPTRILWLDDLAEPPNQYCRLKERRAAGLYTYGTWANTDQFLVSPRDPMVVMKEMIDFLDQEKQLQQNCGTSVPLVLQPADNELMPKTGRNGLCRCGSGLKYKRCCGRF